MPTYDYVCKACGHKLEIFQPMTESAKKKCPECGKSKLERQIGAGAAILFKGSGFYQTDYRSSSYTEGAKKESPGSESKPAAGASKDAGAAKPAETKPAETKPAESKPAPSSEKSSKSARKRPS